MIELTRCVLRPWRASDVHQLVRHADNPRVAQHLRDTFPQPYTEADARDWTDRVANEEPPLNLAVIVHGEAAGGIGLTPQPDVFRRSVEIGYWLGEEYWGRGIMTEAVRAMTEYALSELDVCRVFAGVFEPNPASARVLEKAGYVLEGRLRRAVLKGGQIRDQLVYAYIVEVSP